jgi:hypothetical protein
MVFKGPAMNVFMIVWTFITSHWNDLTATLSTTKLFADTVDSIKKVLPDHLESKKITQRQYKPGKRSCAPSFRIVAA